MCFYGVNCNHSSLISGFIHLDFIFFLLDTKALMFINFVYLFKELALSFNDDFVASLLYFSFTHMIFITSLTMLGFFFFFFSSSFSSKIKLFILDFTCSLVYICITINFHLIINFTLLYRFWTTVFYFHLYPHIFDCLCDFFRAHLQFRSIFCSHNIFVFFAL